jgi:hypothetical protein
VRSGTVVERQGSFRARAARARVNGALGRQRQARAGKATGGPLSALRG